MTALGSIAEIRMGATLRGRDATRTVPNGRFRLVRIGDISHDGQLLTDRFDRIDPEESISADSLLRTGDVLFPNRGTRTTACVFDLSHPDALAGAQFFILRPNHQKLRPAYLAWYLRSDEAARHFDPRRTGTHVKILQRDALMTLGIPLPPLEAQDQIAQVARLQLAERALAEQIARLNARLIHGQLIQAATKLSPPTHP